MWTVKQSHSSNLCPVKFSSAQQQLPRMRHAWTVEHRDFGIASSNAPFLTLGFLTPLCAILPAYFPGLAVFKRQEQQKRNIYEERVRRVERSPFVPLVFTTASSSSQLTTTALKRLASLLSSSRNLPYTVVMGWLRCRLSFCLLRSAIMCMRGIRHRRHHQVENIPDCAYAAAGLNSN